MKRVFWIVLGTILILIAVVLIVGTILPREHTASAERRYDATPESVWRAITDVESYPVWRSSVTEVDVTSKAGEPLTWVETWERGDHMTFRVTDRVPPRHLRVDVADPNLPFSGYWDYDVEPADTGTMLRIVEHGAVDNPAMRFFSHFFMDPTATMNTFLDDLGAELSGAATASPLDTLVTYLMGSFSNAEQAAADTNYTEIRMESVRIWPERADDHWLYIEEMTAADSDRPYRQRVYRVTEPEPGMFRSDIHSIPAPQRFAGAWRENDPLGALSPDSLTQRTGCSVFLRPEGDGFAGGTKGTACLSRRFGFAYVTAEVTVSADTIARWARGYDAEGNQVWGSESGHYVFKRIGNR